MCGCLVFDECEALKKISLSEEYYKSFFLYVVER